jgi:hypothetical protein
MAVPYVIKAEIRNNTRKTIACHDQGVYDKLHIPAVVFVQA